MFRGWRRETSIFFNVTKTTPARAEPSPGDEVYSVGIFSLDFEFEPGRVFML